MSNLHLTIDDDTLKEFRKFLDDRGVSNATYGTGLLIKALLAQNKKSAKEQVIWPPQYEREPRRK